jgi:prevent-host-death family protein
MGAQRTIPAGEFKARCLALLDEVAAGGEELIVTKRGKPVARVVPIAQQAVSLLGSILWEAEDAYAPMPEEWKGLA